MESALIVPSHNWRDPCLAKLNSEARRSISIEHTFSHYPFMDAKICYLHVIYSSHKIKARVAKSQLLITL